MENKPEITSIEQLDQLAQGKEPETTEVNEIQPVESTEQNNCSTEQELCTEEKTVTEESVPAFEPNYKFKVYDQEHEIDEFIRAAIKDEDSNLKVKELYEKAHGLPLIKEKLEKTRNDYSDLQNKYTSATKQAEQKWNNLQSLAKSDFETALEELGVPKDNVINTVAKWLEAEQDPTKQAEYNASRELARNTYQTQLQNQQLMEQYHETLVRQNENELTVAMGSEDVKPVKEYIDSTLGSDAFEKEVRDYALYTYNTTGKDMSASEAVTAVYNKYKTFYTPQQQQQQIVQQPVQPVAQPTVSQQPIQQQPIVRPMPSLKGTAQSPAVKKFKSINDIEAELSRLNTMGE